LNAYLEGDLPAAQRDRVEELLRRNPQARRDLDAWRRVIGGLENAAPPVVPAPPELRTRIMDRLRASGGGGTGGGGTGPAWRWIRWPHVLSVLVLAGLTGTFIHLDHTRQSRVQALPPVSGGQASEASLDRRAPIPPGSQAAEAGGSSGRTQASPADIRSGRNSLPKSRQAYSSETHGILVIGSGAPGARGGERKPGVEKSAAGRAEEVVPAVVSREPGQRLEDASGWTASRLAEVFRLQGWSAGEARFVLRLAQSHNLDPVLLGLAQHDFPRFASLELAGRLRASLNRSAGQPADVRLSRILTDLGGDPKTLLPRWKKALAGDGPRP